MASTVDEITINYSEEEVQLVKELDKNILTHGRWATILFKYQDFDRAANDFGKEKFSIRRYVKRGDSYIQQSKFNISSIDQANKIIEALQNWIKEEK